MTREQLDSMENSVSNTDKDPAASLLRTAWEPAPQGPPDSPPDSPGGKAGRKSLRQFASNDTPTENV